MSTAAAMVPSESRCLLRKEKWLKFHDGQYQFKIPFILYVDFESTLKPVDELYREKMKEMYNVKHHIQKISAYMYCLDGVCTTLLLKEMFLIH